MFVTMKNFLYLSFFGLTILIIHACAQDSGDKNQNSDSQSTTRSAVESSINLRLGQVSNSNSPVAVSAALENGESIVILSRIVGEVMQFDVIYTSTTGEQLTVTFDPTGRPLSAQTRDALVTFSNYSTNTVDVTLQSGSITRVLPAQAIDNNAISFLEGDTMLRILLGLDKDIDSGTRGLLAAAFSSLQIVACSADNILSSFSSFESFVPGVFASISSGACSSKLLDSVSSILNKTDYKEITANNLGNFSQCDIAQTFEELNTCAKMIGEETANAAQEGFTGDYQADIATPTPTPHETHTSTPTPTLSPTPTPTPNLNLGTWSGSAIDSSSTSTCTFIVDFGIGGNGDNTCADPHCRLVGTFNESNGGFPIFDIEGESDSNGHFFFHGTDPGNQETMGATGDFSNGNGTGSGTFTVNSTSNPCSGTFNVSQD